MARVRIEQIEAYLQRHPVPGLAGPYRVVEERAEADEQRFAIRAPAGACMLKRYEPPVAETARREIAGLRLGGEMGLAPTLLLADEADSALGGPTLLVESPAGTALGTGRLSAEDVQGWLFLLLTLHHLLPSQVDVVSSMSPDAATWWQRTQPAWAACRTSYGDDARFASLLDALSRLHAIVGVHVQTNQGLWQRAARRPCHGNPVPAHVLRTASGRLLVEWNGFGLGDPAIEVGRAAALSALSGELSADQYVSFISDYLAGMRDIRDETLEERLRVFASILPLGFCFVMLQHIAEGDEPDPDRTAHVRQIERALVWIQDTLGVDVGRATELLAPLRVTA
jgi:hypothetical protein